jgi:DNA-binding protein WhiA
LSFSSEVKEELARTVPRKRCCRHAEILGLLKACGSLRLGRDGHSVALEAESAPVARKAFRYMKQLYGVQAQILVRRRRRLRNTNVYMVRTSDAEVVDDLVTNLGLNGPEYGQMLSSPQFIRCCSRAFLRGYFLGAGFIAPPGKGHHLELGVSDREEAEQIASLLDRHGIQAKISRRRSGHIVYLKHAPGIVDFLNLTGAHTALLAYENVRAYKTVRSRVNRLVNMDNANLTKVVEASLRQLEDIDLIDRTQGLDSLPDNLASVARLRLQHPDATLEELGQLAQPRVGKSGTNHRMRKIAEIAGCIRRREAEERAT